MMERAALLSGGPELDVGDLGLPEPPPSAAKAELPPAGVDLPILLQNLERNYYERALSLSGGNESQAARLLNVSRDTFRYRRGKLNV